MRSRHCPECNSLNSVSYEGICSFCGWESDSEIQESTFIENQQELDRYRNVEEANSKVMWGFVWVVVGCGISIGSHIFAIDGKLGGFSFIFFGPVIAGLWQILSNFVSSSNSIKIVSVILIIIAVGINYWFYFEDGQYHFSSIYEPAAFDNTKSYQLGTCLSSDGIPVKCDADLASFTVVDLILIETSELPSYVDMRSYTSNCSLNTQPFMPSQARWDRGNRYIYCARPLDDEGDDIIQEYVFSHIEDGACLNNNGFEVRCDSESAKYRSLETIIIEESYFPSSDELSAYKGRCPLQTNLFFYPNDDEWSAGDRKFLCARPLDDGESDIIQEYIFSPRSIGGCINEQNLEVKCVSESAKFIITAGFTMKDSEGPNVDQDTKEKYGSLCPSGSQNSVSPGTFSWNHGNRQFICVKPVTASTSGVSQ